MNTEVEAIIGIGEVEKEEAQEIGDQEGVTFVSLEAIELALIDACDTWSGDPNAWYDEEPPDHLKIRLMRDGPSAWRGRPAVVEWLIKHGSIETLIALGCDAHPLRAGQALDDAWSMIYPGEPTRLYDYLVVIEMAGVRPGLRRRIMKMWPVVRRYLSTMPNKETPSD